MGRIVTRISLEVFPTCLALFSSQAENKAEQSDVYLTEGRANKSDYTDDLIFCACKARGFSHHKGFSFTVYFSVSFLPSYLDFLLNTSWYT